MEKFIISVIFNSVFSTWWTMEIFAIAKADIMRNIASNSKSDG